MRKANEGMTLIELLVAITILAIVVSPFLNSFVTAARQNHKARETLRATTVAENLLEGLEAFSLEEVCTMVNRKEEGRDSKLYLPNGYEKHREAVVITESGNREKSGNGKTGEEYVFESTQSNQYIVEISGIREDEKRYDARVYLDASAYEEVNQNNDFEVNIMNEATDVIFLLSQEEDERILKEKGWKKEEVTRTFQVKIEQEEKETLGVFVKINYKSDGNHGESSIEKSYKKTMKNLKNVYLMYYPNYASNAANKKDIFEVELKSPSKLNLCLVKQEYDEAKPDSGYAAFLEIRDDNSDQKERITLRTNVMEDIYNLGPEGDTQIKATALYYEYYCQGQKVSDDKARQLLGFVDTIPQPLIGQISKENVVYKTRVEIYPQGTYEEELFEETEPIAQLGN